MNLKKKKAQLSFLIRSDRVFLPDTAEVLQDINKNI